VTVLKFDEHRPDSGQITSRAAEQELVRLQFENTISAIVRLYRDADLRVCET